MMNNNLVIGGIDIMTNFFIHFYKISGTWLSGIYAIFYHLLCIRAYYSSDTRLDKNKKILLRISIIQLV